MDNRSVTVVQVAHIEAHVIAETVHWIDLWNALP